MEENKDTRSNFLHMARLAEIAERYEDMREFMKKLVIDKQGEISSLERDLLSVAYKHSVGAHRNAHRTILAVASKRDKYDDEDKAIIEEYRKSIQKQVESVCRELKGLLDEYLIPKNDSIDSKVFYLKMLGDYLRYMAETKEGDEDFGSVVEKSRQAYQQAFDIATLHLPPTDPIRLGLVLNFSVFYFEIANAALEAASLARKAYEDAVAKMEDMDESDYKDSTMIIELLRENLSLWKVDERSIEEDMDEPKIADATEGDEEETKAIEDKSADDNTDKKEETKVITDKNADDNADEKEEKMEVTQDAAEDETGEKLDVNVGSV